MPVALHRELISGAAPARWMVLTHGIYGAGMNWRTIARKLVAARPDWGVALVDLRGHGKSPAGEPPHTLAACADDVLDAARELGAEVIAGHSFGGKVCLVARGRTGLPLAQTWVLDASPGPRPGAGADPSNTVARVLALMRRLPRRWPRREDFVAAIRADGHDAGLAQWLATSLQPDGDGLALRFDLDALHALLEDYYAVDAWPALLAPAPGSVELVIAERSATVSSDERARLARAPAHVHVHAIDAGHWLHIDAPAAVVDLFAVQLPAQDGR